MARDKTHRYQTQVLWTGNLGQGTASYKAYERSHEIVVKGKPLISGSSDPAFRGDKAKYNPEELLVASISACHMLWYLHLCAEASIVVTHYLDQAIGTMLETEAGGGRFVEVVLKPVVTLALGSDKEQAEQLHEQAHHCCFIANSMNFPVLCEPSIQMENDPHHSTAQTMKTPEQCESMADLRAEIDRLDRQVIALLGQRFSYVKAASKFKTSETAVRAPERFQAMLQQRRAWAEEEGLNADAIEKMYQDLVTHFIDEEMKHWKQARQE